MGRTVLTILAFLMLALSACVSTSPATTVATQDASATTALNAAYENAVPVEMQLLLGTLSLTGDLAATDEQASTLVPLWNELRTISMSMGPGQGAPGQSQADATPQPQDTDTETQAQIDALVGQIEAAMTPEQIEAIAAMGITQDSVMTIMQALGITTSGAQPPSGGEPPSGGQMAAPPGGGGMIPPGPAIPPAHPAAYRLRTP